MLHLFLENKIEIDLDSIVKEEKYVLDFSNSSIPYFFFLRIYSTVVFNPPVFHEQYILLKKMKPKEYMKHRL